MDESESVVCDRRIVVEAYCFFCGHLCAIDLRLACVIPGIEYIRSQNVGEQTQKPRIVRIGFEACLRMVARFEGLFRRWVTSGLGFLVDERAAAGRGSHRGGGHGVISLNDFTISS